MVRTGVHGETLGTQHYQLGEDIPDGRTAADRAASAVRECPLQTLAVPCGPGPRRDGRQLIDVCFDTWVGCPCGS